MPMPYIVFILFDCFTSLYNGLSSAMFVGWWHAKAEGYMWMERVEQMNDKNSVEMDKKTSDDSSALGGMKNTKTCL